MSNETPPPSGTSALVQSPAVPFSAIASRPRWTWPDGTRFALCVLLYIEHWELQPPAASVRDPRHVGEFGSFFPDYRTWSQREYGNRVGVFRLLEMLDELGIVPAVAVNAMAFERYPRLIDELARPDVEFIGHGVAATRMITSKLSEAEERAAIEDCAAAIARRTGRRSRGWAGQDFGESTRTPQLLAESGFDYVLDWPNDDQPYLMRTDPPIVSIPTQSEWDDVQLCWMRRIAMPRYPALLAEAATTLADEGASAARVMTIGLHPWLAGMASRVRYVREGLMRVMAIEGVRAMAPREVAQQARGELVSLGPGV